MSIRPFFVILLISSPILSNKFLAEAVNVMATRAKNSYKVTNMITRNVYKEEHALVDKVGLFKNQIKGRVKADRINVKNFVSTRNMGMNPYVNGQQGIDYNAMKVGRNQVLHEFNQAEETRLKAHFEVEMNNKAMADLEMIANNFETGFVKNNYKLNAEDQRLFNAFENLSFETREIYKNDPGFQAREARFEMLEQLVNKYAKEVAQPKNVVTGNGPIPQVQPKGPTSLVQGGPNSLMKVDGLFTGLANVNKGPNSLMNLDRLHTDIGLFKQGENGIMEFLPPQTSLTPFKPQQTALTNIKLEPKSVMNIIPEQTDLTAFTPKQTSLTNIMPEEKRVVNFKPAQTSLANFKPPQTSLMNITPEEKALTVLPGARTGLPMDSKKRLGFLYNPYSQFGMNGFDQGAYSPSFGMGYSKFGYPGYSIYETFLRQHTGETKISNIDGKSSKLSVDGEFSLPKDLTKSFRASGLPQTGEKKSALATAYKNPFLIYNPSFWNLHSDLMLNNLGEKQLSRLGKDKPLIAPLDVPVSEVVKPIAPSFGKSYMEYYCQRNFMMPCSKMIAEGKVSSSPIMFTPNFITAIMSSEATDPSKLSSFMNHLAFMKNDDAQYKAALISQFNIPFTPKVASGSGTEAVSKEPSSVLNRDFSIPTEVASKDLWTGMPIYADHFKAVGLTPSKPVGDKMIAAIEDALRPLSTVTPTLYNYLKVNMGRFRIEAITVQEDKTSKAKYMALVFIGGKLLKKEMADQSVFDEAAEFLLEDNRDSTTLLDMVYYNLMLDAESMCIEELPVANCDAFTQLLVDVAMKLSAKEKRDYTAIEALIKKKVNQNKDGDAAVVFNLLNREETFTKFAQKAQAYRDRIEHLTIQFIDA